MTVNKLLESDQENLIDSGYIQAKELLVKFKDIFATESDHGRTGLVIHSIDTSDARAIKQKPRHVPWDKEEEVKSLIK